MNYLSPSLPEHNSTSTDGSGSSGSPITGGSTHIKTTRTTTTVSYLNLLENIFFNDLNNGVLCFSSQSNINFTPEKSSRSIPIICLIQFNLATTFQTTSSGGSSTLATGQMSIPRSSNINIKLPCPKHHQVQEFHFRDFLIVLLFPPLLEGFNNYTTARPSCAYLL